MKPVAPVSYVVAGMLAHFFVPLHASTARKMTLEIWEEEYEAKLLTRTRSPAIFLWVYREEEGRSVWCY